MIVYMVASNEMFLTCINHLVATTPHYNILDTLNRKLGCQLLTSMQALTENSIYMIGRMLPSQVPYCMDKQSY